MRFLGPMLQGMGINSNPRTEDLFDPNSSGGSNSRSYNGLDPTGTAYAKYLQQALSGNPYSQITGAQPTMNLNALGLTQGQQGGFDQAVRQAMSQLSGGGAQRGFLNPEYAPALAASAAKQVMPQFAPLMSQNLADQFNQNMGNQQLQANLATTRMNQGLNLLPNFRTQDQTSTQRGPGVGYNAANTATSNWFDWSRSSGGITLLLTGFWTLRPGVLCV